MRIAIGDIEHDVDAIYRTDLTGYDDDGWILRAERAGRDRRPGRTRYGYGATLDAAMLDLITAMTGGDHEGPR